ncbi:uncharacterized protein LOC127768232 [Oryza glaberrima]|uniref:Uncharacterized protein n=1 Tax=Oryza glaberrima TaxID=4538 RepID=I1PHA8_ORYGL|nr:uncharacterized protein LOC127768232 [Oryza glaberrima]
MSHGGGGGGQPSCAAVSLSKYLQRKLWKRINGGKPRRRRRPEVRSASGGGEVPVSVELMTTSSWSSSSVRSPEAVVRVVMQGGVVEAYGGVVLACTVIRKHPPGLCLAYPDVFRNPHGARVRPLQPLFPGEKFYLLPERTIERLQRQIPESSVGAFDVDDVTSSTTTTTEEEEEDTRDYSSGAASSSEEEEAACDDDDDGDECAARRWCCAREYFEAKERWDECQFKKMVARGLAVEKSTEKETAMKKKKNGRRRRKKRNSAAVPSTGCRTSRAPATTRRTWEPSLPSVEEERESSPPSERG